MQPIVDRLETEFEGQISFARRNGSTEIGQVTMDAYSLRAHPSFVIVAPDGQALWTFTGQTSAEILRQPIQTYATKTP